MKTIKNVLCALTLFNTYTYIHSMESTHIPICTPDNKEVKINKKYLKESRFFTNFLEDFPDAKTITIPNYSSNDLHILKQSLVVLMSTKKKNMLYLKQFVRNLPHEKLHRLIDMTNFFGIACIYSLSRKVWAMRAIDSHSLKEFYTHGNQEILHQHSFPSDVSNDISKIIIDHILPSLHVEHIRTSDIKNTALFNTEKELSSVALNNNESLIAAGCYDSSIYVYDRTHKYGYKLIDQTTTKEVGCVLFNPTINNTLAAGYRDNTIRL